MNDREKLIELLDQAIEAEFPWEHNGPVADHLIANGVVIQKQGKWHLNEDRKWACSECDGLAVVHPDEPDKWQALTTYCPNCGAKIKEVK